MMFRRVAFVLAALIAAIVLLEAAVRIAIPLAEVPDALYSFYRSDPELGWTGKPGVRLRFRRAEFDTVVEHDPAGWRRPDPAPPADPTRRVLFLGDSFTWGWGVSQGELFTDALQRGVRGRVAVINRGAAAYGTGQEYLVMQRELAAQHYDDVVLMFFANDLPENEDGHRGQRPLFHLTDHRLEGPAGPAAPLMGPVSQFLKDHSHAYLYLYDKVRTLLKRARSSEPVVPDDDRPDIDFRTLPAYDVTVGLLAAMNELARQHGARFFVVYVPSPADVTDRAAHSASIRAIPAMLEDVCRREHIPLINLAPAFNVRAQQGTPLLYPIDQRWTPAGHRLAAEVLMASSIFEDHGSTAR